MLSLIIYVLEMLRNNWSSCNEFFSLLNYCTFFFTWTFESVCEYVRLMLCFIKSQLQQKLLLSKFSNLPVQWRDGNNLFCEN